MHEMLYNTFGIFFDPQRDIGKVQKYEERLNSETKKYYKLINDANEELYPSCKFTKLSFIIWLFQIKCYSGWSKKSFILLLE